ncbi:unnamed protein product [Prorocentrum cordatum]|uniref:CCHC-type domain-containing protein n=1 Tax=Prorocentrum cordatum TaxID=2364126 RepID=A0ABN9TGJ9_9DINO|nr:unnamed protein product [Polarella glacialis]
MASFDNPGPIEMLVTDVLIKMLPEDVQHAAKKMGAQVTEAFTAVARGVALGAKQASGAAVQAAPQDACALAVLEKALHVSKQAMGLKDKPIISVRAASRLGQFSKARNVGAHPDVGLEDTIYEMLSNQDSDVDSNKCWESAEQKERLEVSNFANLGALERTFQKMQAGTHVLKASVDSTDTSFAGHANEDDVARTAVEPHKRDRECDKLISCARSDARTGRMWLDGHVLTWLVTDLHRGDGISISHQNFSLIYRWGRKTSHLEARADLLPRRSRGREEEIEGRRARGRLRAPRWRQREPGPGRVAAKHDATNAFASVSNEHLANASHQMRRPEDAQITRSRHRRTARAANARDGVGASQNRADSSMGDSDAAAKFRATRDHGFRKYAGDLTSARVAPGARSAAVVVETSGGHFDEALDQIGLTQQIVSSESKTSRMSSGTKAATKAKARAEARARAAEAGALDDLIAEGNAAGRASQEALEELSKQHDAPAVYEMGEVVLLVKMFDCHAEGTVKLALSFSSRPNVAPALAALVRARIGGEYGAAQLEAAKEKTAQRRERLEEQKTEEKKDDGGGGRGGGRAAGGDREGGRGGGGDRGDRPERPPRGDRGDWDGDERPSGGRRESTRGEGGSTSTMECYNCGAMGHSSRDCPEPRKEKGGGKGKGNRREMICVNCKKPGHKSRDCPEPVDEAAVAARLAARAAKAEQMRSAADEGSS